MSRQRQFASRSRRALLVCVTVFSWTVSAQETPSLRATLLTSTIDLGDVAPPSSPGQAMPQTSLAVRVVASTFWQLAIVRDLIVEPGDADGKEASVNVEGTWFPLIAGVPVVVAAGQATEGVLVTRQLRIAPTFDTAPGPRRSNLSLMLNGQRVESPVRLHYLVPPTIVVDDDKGQFAVNADQPSERREYDFNPRIFVVRSNAPWVFEVFQRDVKDTATWAQYTIEALDADGQYRPLTGPIRVAAGGRTEGSGVPVAVRLRLKLAEAAVSGTYNDDVEVRARLAGAAVE